MPSGSKFDFGILQHMYGTTRDLESTEAEMHLAVPEIFIGKWKFTVA